MQCDKLRMYLNLFNQTKKYFKKVNNSTIKLIIHIKLKSVFNISSIIAMN